MDEKNWREKVKSFVQSHIVVAESKFEPKFGSRVHTFTTMILFLNTFLCRENKFRSCSCVLYLTCATYSWAFHLLWRICFLFCFFNPEIGQILHSLTFPWGSRWSFSSLLFLTLNSPVKLLDSCRVWKSSFITCQSPSPGHRGMRTPYGLLDFWHTTHSSGFKFPFFNTCGCAFFSLCFFYWFLLPLSFPSSLLKFDSLSELLF